MVRSGSCLTLLFLCALMLTYEAECNPLLAPKKKQLAAFLKSLKEKSLRRHIRSIMESNALPVPEKQGSLEYVQPEDVSENFLPKQRPVSHERVKRHRFGNGHSSHRGCNLGTCQVQNLASLLYRIGANTGKDESRNTADPFSYGRKRRSLREQKSKAQRAISRWLRKF